MNTTLKTFSAVTLSLFLSAAGGAALAKGHDNGVGDGSPSGNPSVGGQTAGPGGNAVSGGQKDGQRGAAASAAGQENRGANGSAGQGDDRR